MGCLVAERLPSAANLGWVGWRVGRNRYYYYEERNETEAALIKGPPLCPGGDPWHLHMQPVPAGVARWPVGIPSPACCQSGPAAPAGLLGSLQLSIYPALGAWPPGGVRASATFFDWDLQRALLLSLSFTHHSSTQPHHDSFSRLAFSSSCLALNPSHPLSGLPSHLHLPSSPFSIKHLLQNGRTPSKAGHCW